MRPMVSRSTFSWEYKDIEHTAIKTQASRRKGFIIRAPEEGSNRGLYSFTLGLKAKGIVKFLQVERENYFDGRDCGGTGCGCCSAAATGFASSPLLFLMM